MPGYGSPRREIRYGFAAGSGARSFILALLRHGSHLRVAVLAPAFPALRRIPDRRFRPWPTRRRFAAPDRRRWPLSQAHIRLAISRLAKSQQCIYHHAAARVAVAFHRIFRTSALSMSPQETPPRWPAACYRPMPISASTRGRFQFDRPNMSAALERTLSLG